MALVLGRIFGILAISSAPELSSNDLQNTLGAVDNMVMPQVCISLRSSMIGMTSRKALESAMYSASVEDRAISLCYLELQIIGQPANIMIAPDLDFAVVAL